jgi:hypothetical protein
MHKFGRVVSNLSFSLFLVFGPMSGSTVGADLSRYRKFQLGAELSTVVKQAGAGATDVKVIHRRPALIQELEWRPQSLGAISRVEAAKQVVFSFYDGKLFRIAINYDRYDIEGLTTGDLLDAISATYGKAEKPATPIEMPPGQYGDKEEMLAQWQDSQYCFELIRSSYGPDYKLVGTLKTLREPARSAMLEAARLDAKEAPQREAERIATEDATERIKLEKARLVNKPKFRP